FDKKIQTLHMNPGAAGIYGFHKVRTLLRFVLDAGNIRDLEVIELGER
ncbi:MAG: YfcE family phosphodiesterase, partial [Bacteroidales bacterium]|nr:YfcE family phosphodiesterase [Bacteroidales bacterium]